MSENGNMLRVAAAIDDFITLDLACLGVSGPLFAALQRHQPGPMCLGAARFLLDNLPPEDGLVCIATGFPMGGGVPETDGPVGAAMLARALHQALGVTTVLVTDQGWEESLRAACIGAGLSPMPLQENGVERIRYLRPVYVAAVPRDEASAANACARIMQLKPDMLIAIERPGKNHLGVYHGMKRTPLGRLSFGCGAAFLSWGVKPACLCWLLATGAMKSAWDWCAMTFRRFCRRPRPAAALAGAARPRLSPRINLVVASVLELGRGGNRRRPGRGHRRYGRAAGTRAGAARHRIVRQYRRGGRGERFAGTGCGRHTGAGMRFGLLRSLRGMVNARHGAQEGLAQESARLSGGPEFPLLTGGVFTAPNSVSRTSQTSICPGACVMAKSRLLCVTAGKPGYAAGPEQREFGVQYVHRVAVVRFVDVRYAQGFGTTRR